MQVECLKASTGNTSAALASCFNNMTPSAFRSNMIAEDLLDIIMRGFFSVPRSSALRTKARPELIAQEERPLRGSLHWACELPLSETQIVQIGLPGVSYASILAQMSPRGCDLSIRFTV